MNHIHVLVPLFILWFIWCARNAARFEGAPMVAHCIIGQVGDLVEQLGSLIS